jgi:hypothetical protein
LQSSARRGIIVIKLCPTGRRNLMKLMKTVFLPLAILGICIVWLMADSSFSQADNKKDKESAKTTVQRVISTPSDKSDVIGYLETRDKVVTIGRGTKGAVYTVKNKAGKVLAVNLNDKDFQAKFPGLFDQVKNGLAGKAGNDASLRKNSRVPPSVNDR